MPAAQPVAKRIDLWSEPAEFSTLDLYLPDENPTRTAVIICPGGGYGGLSEIHEGSDVAQWFNDHQIAAFVLRYRHGKQHLNPAPVEDARRAIQYVRHHGDKFQIDPDRVGIMGFSAGGHLASVSCTHLHDGNPHADDPIARHPAVPSFAILAYPVITFIEPFSHGGSRDHFLGENADTALLEKFSSERQVTERTPPTFLYHTDQDQPVPAENAVRYYLALRQHGIPAELHIFRPGKHGTSLGQNDPILAVWPKLLANWMVGLGLMAEQHHSHGK